MSFELPFEDSLPSSPNLQEDPSTLSQSERFRRAVHFLGRPASLVVQLQKEQFQRNIWNNGMPVYVYGGRIGYLPFGLDAQPHDDSVEEEERDEAEAAHELWKANLALIAAKDAVRAVYGLTERKVRRAEEISKNTLQLHLRITDEVE